MNFAYTVFQGRVGDHNDLAMPGARSIGEALARRTGVQPFLVGTPEPALSIGWREELDVALPAVDGYLTKPFSFLDLKSLIEALPAG